MSRELEAFWGKTINRQAAGKIPVDSTEIRTEYYGVGDHLSSLVDAIKSDKATKGDKKLVKAVEDLQKAFNAVHEALKPYNWD